MYTYSYILIYIYTHVCIYNMPFSFAALPETRPFPSQPSFPKLHTADMLCDTADMSAVGHSRHVYCVALQTCLLCDEADTSDV